MKGTHPIGNYMTEGQSCETATPSDTVDADAPQRSRVEIEILAGSLLFMPDFFHGIGGAWIEMNESLGNFFFPAMRIMLLLLNNEKMRSFAAHQMKLHRDLVVDRAFPHRIADAEGLARHHEAAIECRARRRGADRHRHGDG